MVFSSFPFLCVFLPAVLTFYYICPRKLRNLLLLVASLIFYAWGEPIYILIMLFSTVFDFCNGLLIERFHKRGNAKGKKVVLVLSVVVNIGLMCFFKYTDFIIGSINSISGAEISLLHIALPIGISFYTFQTLSYTIDVYRGEVSVQHNIINFGMYVSMFPQLIAGPIVRYADIEHQVDVRNENSSKFFDGIVRFTAGLGKKVLLANQIGSLWDSIYSGGGTMPALTAWLGALAFAFQIYFDFSGYSDMAIGLGKMFGFDFPENFLHPYEAKSITEFWRRWHVTLGTWFREYLYIPLGGNRVRLPRQIINLLIVWFLTGLWHGAGWNFILWGLYYFVILICEKIFLLKALKKLPIFMQHIYALFFILIGWVIFACDDITVLLPYVKSLFGAGSGLVDSMSLYYLRTNLLPIIIMAFGCTGLPLTLAKRQTALKICGRNVSFALKAVFCLAMLFLSVVFLVGDTYNPFLYFRF